MYRLCCVLVSAWANRPTGRRIASNPAPNRIAATTLPIRSAQSTSLMRNARATAATPRTVRERTCWANPPATASFSNASLPTLGSPRSSNRSAAIRVTCPLAPPTLDRKLATNHPGSVSFAEHRRALIGAPVIFTKASTPIIQASPGRLHGQFGDQRFNAGAYGIPRGAVVCARRRRVVPLGSPDCCKLVRQLRAESHYQLCG